MAVKKASAGGIIADVRRDELQGAWSLLEGYALARVIILRGEMGSGRTTALTRLAERAQRRGVGLLSASAYVAQATLQPADVTEQRTAVIVDDLDLIDADLRSRLYEALRTDPAAHPPILLASAAATTEFDRSARFVDLAPLGAASTKALLAALEVSGSRSTIAQLLAATKGNLALLMQAGAEAEYGRLAVPSLFSPGCQMLPTPYHYLAHDYRALPHAQQVAALQLAMLESLPSGEGTSHPAVHPDAGGLIVQDGAAHFASAIHRAAVLLTAPAELRREAHLRLLPQADPLDAALHLIAMGRGDEDTAREALNLLDGSCAEGWASLLHLVRTQVGKPERRLEAGVAALTASVVSGDLEHTRELAEHLGDDIAMSNRNLVVRVLKRAFMDGEVAASLNDARQGLASDPEPQRALDLAAAYATICLVLDDPQWWHRWRDDARALRLVDRRIDELCAEVDAAFGGPPPAGAVELACTGESPSRDLLAVATAALRAHRMQRQDMREIAALSLAARRTDLAGMIAATQLALLQLADAQWDAALESATALARRAEGDGAAVLALSARATAALAAGLLGDTQTAHSHAVGVLGSAQTRELPAITDTARRAIVVCHLSNAEADAALPALTGISGRRALTTDAVYPAAVIDLAEVRLMKQGRDIVADPESTTIVPLSAPSERTGFAISGARAAGEQDLDALETLLRSARGGPYGFERARLRLILGTRLVHDRAVDAAEHHLRIALAEFESLGARRWYERTATALKTLESGIRATSGEPTTLLTEQEERIASLAAAGLSNKEIGSRLFLSPRTVGGHLYNVFPKLGVSSRAGLRDALLTLGLDKRETVELDKRETVGAAS